MRYMYLFFEKTTFLKGEIQILCSVILSFFVDVVVGMTRLPCKCNWCQFEVIGNDALWNSLPETDYIYTVAGFYKRVICC